MNKVKYYLENNPCYRSGRQREPIGIQVHTIGCAQGTAKSVADYWNQSSVEACVTYICDSDVEGKVLQLLPEWMRSWADAGWGNNSCITIECCESDYMKYVGGANYVITDKAKFIADIKRSYNTCVELCAEICKRYGWNPSDKLANGLCRISDHNEGRLKGLSSGHVDTSHLWGQIGKSIEIFRHDVEKALNGEINVSEPQSTGDKIEEKQIYRVRKSWSDVTSQIGAYEILENAKNNCPSGYSVFDINGKEMYSVKSVGTQAADIKGTEKERAEMLLELVKRNDNSGILYSVTTAQAILESGYCSTDLSLNANNLFGMKKTLSGNDWTTVWDGHSVYNKNTKEQDAYGNEYTVNADFRKYQCVEDSIRDHSMYLLGAKNGTEPRYKNLINAKSYYEAICIIKNGGYATDTQYISKISSIIQKYNLDRYDKVPSESNKTVIEPPKASKLYIVQVGFYNSSSKANTQAKKMRDAKIDCIVAKKNDGFMIQCGAYEIEENAKKKVEELKKNSYIKKNKIQPFYFAKEQ